MKKLHLNVVGSQAARIIVTNGECYPYQKAGCYRPHHLFACYKKGSCKKIGIVRFRS